MKGQRVRRELQRARHLAGRHSVRSGLDEQAKHVETTVLGEGGQGRHGVSFFHNSTNIEMSVDRQGLSRGIEMRGAGVLAAKRRAGRKGMRLLRLTSGC